MKNIPTISPGVGAQVNRRAGGSLLLRQLAPSLFWYALLIAAAVGAMQRWRSVHLPLTITFGTLALMHVVSILVFWRW